jgi:hypothetical protein
MAAPPRATDTSSLWTQISWDVFLESTRAYEGRLDTLPTASMEQMLQPGKQNASPTAHSPVAATVPGFYG